MDYSPSSSNNSLLKITSHCPKPEGESWPTEHNCTLILGSWTYDIAKLNPNFKGPSGPGDALSFKYMTNKKVCFFSNA